MVRRFLKKMKPRLRQIFIKLSEPSPPNLLGDRDIEHSWIAANLPDGPGKALDFGSGIAWMGLLAARKGFEVKAIDLLPVNWYYSHSALQFEKMDLFDLDLEEYSLDLIINCSTIEHVGLKGSYNVMEGQPKGDFEAMELIQKYLKPGKLMLMTLPVGKDKIHYPSHRVYGSERLPELLNGWDIVKEEFWIKDDQNNWIQTTKDVALNTETQQHYYGLGLFVLKPVT